MEKCGRAGVQSLGGQSSSGYRFTVVIICDGDDSEQRALERLRKVTSIGAEDFTFEVRLWPLQVFEHEGITIASDDLAAADLLILALEDVEGLDESVRNRLQGALLQMRSESAAVATLTKNEAVSSACFDFLHLAAEQAGIEFIFPVATALGKSKRRIPRLITATFKGLIDSNQRQQTS